MLQCWGQLISSAMVTTLLKHIDNVLCYSLQEQMQHPDVVFTWEKCITKCFISEMKL